MTSVKRADNVKPGAMRVKTASFFRGAWAELKKVHWPTRKEIITYTGVVLVSVAFVSLLIWMADSLLSVVMESLFEAVGK